MDDLSRTDSVSHNKLSACSANPEMRVCMTKPGVVTDRAGDKNTKSVT